MNNVFKPKTRLVRHNKFSSVVNNMVSSTQCRDLSMVPSFSFGFVDCYLQKTSEASGKKNIGKAVKYFDEEYVHGLTGKCTTFFLLSFKPTCLHRQIALDPYLAWEKTCTHVTPPEVFSLLYLCRKRADLSKCLSNLPHLLCSCVTIWVKKGFPSSLIGSQWKIVMTSNICGKAAFCPEQHKTIKKVSEKCIEFHKRQLEAYGHRPYFCVFSNKKMWFAQNYFCCGIL